MSKEINLKDGNIIRLDDNESGIIIEKGYFKNGELSKILTMSMTNDFGFEAFIFLDEETDSVEFSIPQNDPLYKHLSTLLGQEDSLVIDDDMTTEEKQKYMEIKRQGQEILVGFCNRFKNASTTDKFIITIINIMEDGRSKIFGKGLDIKSRLVTFFYGARSELLRCQEQDGEER